MKYLKQLLIICVFCLLGEILNHCIPLSIPASIYGMVLLFIALCTKIIKLDWVEEISQFLMSIMLVFFVPMGVGIMNTFITYKNSMVSLILIIFISTIVVIVSTGLVSQLIINMKEKRKQ